MNEDKKEYLTKATITYDITKPNLGCCSIEYGEDQPVFANGYHILNNWKEELKAVFDNLAVAVVDTPDYEDYAENAECILLDAANELANLTSCFLKSVDRNINYDYENPANISTVVKEVKLYPRIELELYNNSDIPARDADAIKLQYKGYIGTIKGYDNGSYVGRIFPPDSEDYIEYETDSFGDIWKEFTETVDYYIVRRKMHDKCNSSIKATVEVDNGNE